MSIAHPTDAAAAGTPEDARQRSSRPGRTGPRPDKPANNKQGKRHYGTHVFLIVMAAIWLVPLGWAIFTALRPKADTDKYGYFSTGGAFNFDNFTQAWTQGGFAQLFWNSVLITVPSVVPDPFLRLHDGVRREPGELEVQHHPADHVYRRKPAAPAGARGAAL